MFDRLEIFRMAQGLAVHSAARQATIAENIANADTPGYRARDLQSFSESYQLRGDAAMRVTRAGHLPASVSPQAPFDTLIAERPGATAPNGNSVSLEQEMMQAAMTKGQHDRALAVYKSALTVIRTAVNGGR